MNTLPMTGRQLPHWVNEPSNWYSQRRPHWLHAVHSARLSTLRRCLHVTAKTTADIGHAVDDLIGLMLMRRFVSHRSIIAAPGFWDVSIDGAKTVRCVCNRYRGELASPLLQSVFDLRWSPIIGQSRSMRFRRNAIISHGWEVNDFP